MRTNASLYFFIAMIFDSEWIRTRIVYIHLGQVDIDSTSTPGVKTQLLSSVLFVIIEITTLNSGDTGATDQGLLLGDVNEMTLLLQKVSSTIA